MSSGPDVSEGGQVTYACALAAAVQEDHPGEEDWGDLGEDRAYNEFSAIRPLLGGAVPQRMDDEDNRFADLDWSAYSEGPGAWGTLLDKVVDACNDS